MPLPNHVIGSRQQPTSSYYDTTITRTPNKTIYNVYGSKKRKEKTGEAEVEISPAQRNRMQTSAEKLSRGYRPTTRATSQTPPTSRYATTTRTRSATPARSNGLMSRSAGTGCPPTTTWIPSGGRFNTSPRTYYSKARTLEAEKQAALAAATMAASSPPATLSSNVSTGQRAPTPKCRMTMSQKSTSAVQRIPDPSVQSQSVTNLSSNPTSHSTLSLQVNERNLIKIFQDLFLKN